MEQLNTLDVIFLVIVGISALVGIARGMTKELLSIFGWVLAAAALFYLTPAVNVYTEQYVASKMLANIVSGIVIVVIFSIIWVLTVDKLASVIRSSKLSALDRIFGFVFGMARGALVIILIVLMISSLMPEESKKGVFKESVMYAKAEACIEPLKAAVPQSWIETAQKQTERFGFGKKKAETKVAEENTKTDDKSVAAKEDSKADDKTDVNVENNDKNGDKAEDKNKKPSLAETLKNIDNNLDVLQKNGEDLFNKLAQPKTGEQNDAAKDSAADEFVSDLDKLLDVLEDRVVTTDKNTPKPESEAQKTNVKVKEFNQ